MYKDTKTITVNDFFKKYNPQLNHFSSSPDDDNYTFEIFDEELEYVKKQNNKQIWTTVSCENEEFWIIPGYHIVNRMNYYITEKEWEYENIQVNDNEMCTIEEAIDYCISFGEMQFNVGFNKYDVGQYFNENLDPTFNGEMTTGRAKYIAIEFIEKTINDDLSDEHQDLIHNFYSQL